MGALGSDGGHRERLARALQDYGRLVKTLFILRYLQQPELRKRVGRQLNKGESLFTEEAERETWPDPVQ